MAEKGFIPIKIVGDGTRMGTKVINVETGEVLPYVISVDFHMDSTECEAQITMKVPKAQVEIEGDFYPMIGGQINGVLLPFSNKDQK